MIFEKQIADDSRDINAAEYAEENKASYPKAQKILNNEQQDSKSFEEIAKNSDEQDGDPTEDSSESSKDSEKSQNENASADNQAENKPGEKLPSTLEELSEYKEMLDRLSRESKKLEGRALSKLEQEDENKDFVAAMLGKDKATKGSGEGAGSGSGKGKSDGNSNADGGKLGDRSDKHSISTGILSDHSVLAEALPGRRISKNATRNGWVYVNTWYMIGPWDMHKDYRINRKPFAIPHPPEDGIDFDAVYTDGLVGSGVRESSPEPKAMWGKTVALDGVLRWKFMQSESLFNKMPVTTNGGCYYAYTEIYCDEDRDMMISIGTDDRAKVWINNKLIWSEKAELSDYKIDEYIKSFHFKKGVNKVLVRINNGGDGVLGFSFLLCPPDHPKFKNLNP